MLTLQIPKTHSKEIRWIVNVILEEFLGIDYQLIEKDEEFYRFEFGGKTLTISDVFFCQDTVWQKKPLKQNQPFSTWNINSSRLNIPSIVKPLPVLFGYPKLELSESHIRLDIDVFGSAFFMLSRYEELFPSELDKHKRFQASSSFAS